MENVPEGVRRCSRATCSRELPLNATQKTCDTCRELGKLHKANSRKRQRENDTAEDSRRQPQPPIQSRAPLEAVTNHINGEETTFLHTPVPSLSRDAETASQDPDTRAGCEANPDAFENNNNIPRDPTCFDTLQDFFVYFRDIVQKGNPRVHARIFLPADPLVTFRERVRITSEEIWSVSGWRFT
ncbi:hypothetical protein SISNIDRAFT_482988 [Sistotremastrum niveocremeum HHB9708]|uniref:Uncharacterized protein n=1 Tax=Sistotremastrum niveocremeum HHB9708 TaxID=1314777 RepID=A0A164XYZ1_9AGAM|nr:hypothetical protein SISNIDRAFT_482988 [Sistotremastrum niveocremeum HHB9708]